MSATRLPDPTDLAALRTRLTDGVGPTRRPIGLDRIRIGADAIDQLVADVDDVRGRGDVVLLVDETPMTRDGADLKSGVLDRLASRFDARLGVVRADGTELHADEAALAQADSLVSGAGCVVALGSGTIADIAKDATMRAGNVPLVVVQTAVSVNAFSDDMAVLLRNGVKRTVPSRWPDVLLIDLAILAEAPAAMNRAGFGELCAMFTAPADWYLATAVGIDDTFDPAVVALFREGAEGLLAGAERVRDNDPAMLAELAARMTLTGLAMGAAGRTAPLSGTEHLLSHLLDMAATSDGRALAFHGAQVGVACVLAATIWQDTLDRFDPSVLTTDAAFPDAATMERRVRAAFDPVDPSGRMSDECWRDVTWKLARWHGSRAAVESFAADWPRHRSTLAGLVGDPEVLRRALAGAGAAATVADLDPPAPADTVRWALRSLPLMRDRFTVADLWLFGGAWDERTTGDLLARSGILGDAAVRP